MLVHSVILSCRSASAGSLISKGELEIVRPICSLSYARSPTTPISE